MEIKIETGGQRLDKALSDLTELSRSLANEQIKAGQVLVNGQVKKAKYTVQEGDIVTYHVPEPEVLEYVAEDIPLEIITKTFQNVETCHCRLPFSSYSLPGLRPYHQYRIPRIGARRTKLFTSKNDCLAH